jgi:hypothetical protein
MDVVERLKGLTAETKRIKDAGTAQTMERMSSMGERIPPVVLGAFSAMSSFGLELAGQMIRASNWKPTPGGLAMPAPGVNLVATNVPGPQAPWYFAGYRVVDTLGLLPLGGNLGYGVAIVSYDQHIVFSMMADARLMPDVEKMKEFNRQAFDELVARVPAEFRPASVTRISAKAAA